MQVPLNAPTPTPTPAGLLETVSSIANSAGPSIAVALSLVGWLATHWQDLASIAALALALYHALRAAQWSKAVSLAGDLAYKAAGLAELSDRGKRDMVSDRLHDAIGPIGRGLFSKADIERAVEEGWKLIAKPKLASEAP